MRRRGPRWRVTYLLEQNGRRMSAHWPVRAASESEAVELARLERAAWDAERGDRARGIFDNAWATPYTTSDAMDDGTSWVSWALFLILPAFLVLAVMGFHGARGVLPIVAAYGWSAIEVMTLIGFIGWLLYGAVALVYAGVTVLRERREDREWEENGQEG